VSIAGDTLFTRKVLSLSYPSNFKSVLPALLIPTGFPVKPESFGQSVITKVSIFVLHCVTSILGNPQFIIEHDTTFAGKVISVVFRLPVIDRIERFGQFCIAWSNCPSPLIMSSVKVFGRETIDGVPPDAEEVEDIPN
jgi:hypothetical protein